MIFKSLGLDTSQLPTLTSEISLRSLNLHDLDQWAEMMADAETARCIVGVILPRFNGHPAKRVFGFKCDLG